MSPTDTPMASRSFYRCFALQCSVNLAAGTLLVSSSTLFHGLVISQGTPDSPALRAALFLSPPYSRSVLCTDNPQVYPSPLSKFSPFSLFHCLVLLYLPPQCTPLFPRLWPLYPVSWCTLRVRSPRHSSTPDSPRQCSYPSPSHVPSFCPALRLSILCFIQK